MSLSHHLGGCDSCGETNCRLSFSSRGIAPVLDRTAYVLDEVWPEFDSYITANRRDDDQVLAPGLFGKTLPRYAWSGARPMAGWATLSRHLAMHRVARAAGKIRQAAYLKADADVAAALGRKVDFTAGHLVVQQTLLPFLWRDGVLGGRTFDVLMTRYPLGDLHRRLDEAAKRWPQSPTIADFRAPASIVAAETAALGAARRLITPHHDIALGFAGRGHWLAWRSPAIKPETLGHRTAFLGPSIARQGAYEVRELAGSLPEPLIVFGQDLEAADFWTGVTIERRVLGRGWLADIGTIVHPAVVTHQPRRLLEAAAHGVAIHAHPSCGLAPGQFVPFDTATAALRNNRRVNS